MDQIIIDGLEIFANHGVFPEENRLGQKFVISAVLYADTRMAGKSDDLEKSIHYGEVSQTITEVVQGHTFQLIETVVEKLAEELLLSYPLLKGVRLRIEKPWAPVGLPLRTVGVDSTGLAHGLRGFWFESGRPEGLRGGRDRGIAPDERLSGTASLGVFCHRTLRGCGAGGIPQGRSLPENFDDAPGIAGEAP